MPYEFARVVSSLGRWVLRCKLFRLSSNTPLVTDLVLRDIVGVEYSNCLLRRFNRPRLKVEAEAAGCGCLVDMAVAPGDPDSKVPSFGGRPGARVDQ